MSDTTPDPVSPDPVSPDAREHRVPTGAAAAAPEPLAEHSAVASTGEPYDADPEVADPPSGPISARGHVNRSVSGATAGEQPLATPSAAVVPESPIVPESSSVVESSSVAEPVSVPESPFVPEPIMAESVAPVVPPAVTEPEPVVSTDDDIAAAIARTAAQPGEPGATAAGTAIVDTASPVPPVLGWVPEATGVAMQPQPVPPILVKRPEPPKRKSNRGTGILIVLVGTVAFALLWSAAVVVVGALVTPSDEFVQALLQYYTQQISGWVPVVAFFVGMVVLVQIINRARWWGYILGGLIVAIFVYFCYVGAYLIDARFLERTPAEFAILLRNAWLNPFAVLAGVIAREISVWTGAWLSGRGRRLKARNAEAQADYEQRVADAQNQAVAVYASQQGY